MAFYTGPKARINRRLGTLIYEDAGAARAMQRRDQKPGMHQRPRRPSNYGLALMEKQKIRHYYGLGEAQLRRYFGKVSRTKGNTGQLLLILCERRLDNVVRRAGFTSTRPQARQGVVHGHFQVNGTKTDVPSYQVKVGDEINWNESTKSTGFFKERTDGIPKRPVPAWLDLNQSDMTGRVMSLPADDDLQQTINSRLIVEFYSR